MPRSQRHVRYVQGKDSTGSSRYPGDDYVWDWAGTWPSGSGGSRLENLVLPSVSPALTDGEYKVSVAYTAAGAAADDTGGGSVGIVQGFEVDRTIAGTPSYTPVAGDYGGTMVGFATFTVTGGENDGWSETHYVDSGLVTDAVPTNTADPTITGDTTLGSTLTVTDNGDWDGLNITGYSHQWQFNGMDIPNAMGISITTTDLFAGGVVICNVTAHNLDGPSAPASSNDIQMDSLPTAPGIQTDPTISGDEVVGGTLLADRGLPTGDPAPTPTGQWHNIPDGPILNATGDSYVLQASDEGGTVYFEQIETNTEGTASANSNVTGVIAEAPATPVIDSVVLVEYDDGTPDELQVTFAAGTVLPVDCYMVQAEGTGPYTGDQIETVDTNATTILEGEDWSETGSGHSFTTLTRNGINAVPAGLVQYIHVVAKANGLYSNVITGAGAVPADKVDYAPPTRVSGETDDVDATTVVETFSKDVFDNATPAGNFSFSVAGGGYLGATAISGSGTTRTLTLNTPPSTSSDAILAAYAPGTVVSHKGNPLAAYAAQSVENKVPSAGHTFTDDFSTYTIGDALSTSANWDAGWTFGGRVLEKFSGDYAALSLGSANGGAAVIYAGKTDLGDAELSLTADDWDGSGTNNYVAFILRSDGHSGGTRTNEYWIQWDTNANTVYIGEITSTTESELTTLTGVTSNNGDKLTMRATGTNPVLIECLVNDVVQGSHSDTTALHTGGHFGFADRRRTETGANVDIASVTIEEV